MGIFPLISIGTNSYRQWKNKKHRQLLPVASNMEEVSSSGQTESTAESAFRKLQLFSSQLKYNILVKMGRKNYLIKGEENVISV